MKKPNVTEDELRNALKKADILTPQISKIINQAKQSHLNQKRDDGKPTLSQHIFPIAFSTLKTYKNHPNLELLVSL